MYKISFQKNRKNAQHIVEFTILLPFFMFAFALIFPILAETYGNSKFSYHFLNFVKRTINNQPIYNNLIDASNYNIQEIMMTESSLFSVTLITTMQTAFIVGGKTGRIRTIFGVIGKNYFYSVVPVNRAFTEPSVLPFTKTTLQDSFNDSYYGAPRSAAFSSSTDVKSAEKEEDEALDGALGG